jgi:hypothetical protein
MPVQGRVKTSVTRCWRWLGNCFLRPQATVLKSFPASQVNSFDCSLNRHEITVYCWLSFWIVSVLYCILWFTVGCLSGLWVFCTVFYDLLLIVFLDCGFFCTVFYDLLLIVFLDCEFFCTVFYDLLLIVFLDCEFFFVLYFMIYCWLSFWIVNVFVLYFMI